MPEIGKSNALTQFSLPPLAATPAPNKKPEAVSGEDAPVIKPLVKQHSLKNNAYGRGRVASMIEEAPKGMPIYSAKIGVKTDKNGTHFTGMDGMVKSLLDFTHKMEVDSGDEYENSLHDLVGKEGTDVSVTGTEGLLVKMAVLKSLLGPKMVAMMKSGKDRDTQMENVKGDVLATMMYDQMELGGAAWGPKKICINIGDEETGAAEMTIPEFLGGLSMKVNCANSELKERILVQLRRNPGAVADVQAEMIRAMDGNKSITKKMLKGFTMSAVVSVAAGSVYEYVISQKGLKPLLKGAKDLVTEDGKYVDQAGKVIVKSGEKFIKSGNALLRRIAHEAAPAAAAAGENAGKEVTGPVFKIAPHLLPPGSKALGVVIDDIPPGVIEVLDTLGALIMKSGDDAENNKKIEIQHHGDTVLIKITEAGEAEEEEEESKIKGALIGGGISMVTALPSMIMEYFEPTNLVGKTLFAIGAVMAELAQISGATAGVSRELREDLTSVKAQLLELQQQGIVAASKANGTPGENKAATFSMLRKFASVMKHVEQIKRQVGITAPDNIELDSKAKRQIARTSRTAVSQAAIGSGMLLAVFVAIMGEHFLNQMSGEKARPFKSAVYQPWEAIGMMIITLGAMYMGLRNSKLPAWANKIVNNDAQKSDRRAGAILDRHAEGKKITWQENMLIDKPFLSLLGQGSISLMATLCAAGIKAGNNKLFEIWPDKRDEPRLPFPERSPVRSEELHELDPNLYAADGSPRFEEIAEPPVAMTADRVKSRQPQWLSQAAAEAGIDNHEAIASSSRQAA